MSARKTHYDRPSVTVDCVVFGVDEAGLKLLLVERGVEPFAGQWALPGGFVKIDESLDTAARRELQEETGLHDLYLEQLYTFGQVDRDPRERVISVAYVALVNVRDHQVQAATDARQAAWHLMHDLPTVAFDHDRIIHLAQERLRGKVRYHRLGFHLLPPEFTLTQLQRLHETILDESLDKRNFRKKALATGVIVATGNRQRDVPHRAAQLYRFDEQAYQRLIDEGHQFEL